MKLIILYGAAALIFFTAAAPAQETREIKVIEDRDQTYMTSKVYELKNVLASDITPFVQGAVKRYYKESSVERMNDKANKRQILVVNMPVSLIPYIDDLVEKLDRPNGIKDEKNSVVQGTGITKFVYAPKNRASVDMLPIGPAVGSADGSYYFDSISNLFYWKDTRAKAELALKWYQAFDRPVPQVELTLNVYEINDNDIKELGIDYLSWKNGPGANLFNANWDFANIKTFTDVSNPANITDIAGKASHAWGGFLVAPNIDATFIRLLAQKGKEKVSTSGALTFVNDYTHDPGSNNFAQAKYKIRFTPNYQNIQKDKDQTVSVNQVSNDFQFYLRRPTINFTGETGEKAAALSFGWELFILDTVEETNKGTPVQNINTFRSWLTLETDTEKLLGTYEREHEVNQYNGIPFLGDIPVLKYLFGAMENSKAKTKVFVTATAKPITPTENFSVWSGKALTARQLIEAKKEN
ncbi:MAG: hypothetical protein WAX69_13545 [Victivallales bacterium]